MPPGQSRGADAARVAAGLAADAEPTEEQVTEAARELLKNAAAPLASNPALRNQILEMRQRYEQTIDHVSQDIVLEAAYSEQAREKAKELVASVEQFISDNKDEITAPQVHYNRPTP